MENKLEKSRAEIDKFVSDKPVLDLVDTILSLDGIKPYVELSQNGDAGEFLQRKGISVVHSKADFDYLYESLKSRIESLEGKDERAKTYLQRAEYQKQMAEIPELISGLEKKISALKEQFNAMIRTIYEIGIKCDYDIHEDVRYILKRKYYKADFFMGGDNDEVEIGISLERYKDGDWNELFFTIYPEYEMETTIEKKGIFNRIHKKTIETSKVKDLLLQGNNLEESTFFEENFYPESIDSLTIILNFPRIIEKYFKKKNRDIEGIISLNSRP